MEPKKWWHYLFLTFLVCALVGSALASLAASIIYPTLPSLESLTNYKPKLPLKVYSTEGLLIGEFGEERRAFVKIENVPKTLINAVLAIEDRRFYQHNGVDLKGIIRAIKNNLTGRSHEGASTITMQVAKNFFSPPGTKRDMSTKIKEAMLAFKIEKTLSKNQILELYLNQIYLGQRSYGFAAASQVYFGKQIKDLNLAESALLAGLPKAPSGYNPYVHKASSLKRQHEVLRDMTRYGFIDSNQYDEAIKYPLIFKSAKKSVKKLNADYVAEIVRQTMYKQYGESIYQSGFSVYTTIKKQNQEAANLAVIHGIIDYDKRHGYRGPEKKITLPASANLDELASNTLDNLEVYNGFTPALVTEVNKTSIKLISKSGEHLELKDQAISLIKNVILNNKVNERLQVIPGAVIRIVYLDQQWQVVQLPEVEASIIAVNPETGAVNALVGGFDYNLNKFNHITQGWRQPGSNFKPFIYSASLEKGYSPASIFDDAPFTLEAGERGNPKAWTPHNYDEKYAGPMRMRTALTKSKNMVSIRILNAIGPKYAQSYITKFGFSEKDHPAYLTMALGAGSTTSWHLAAAYSVFANTGYRVSPYIISKVLDNQGKVLTSVKPSAHVSAERVIDPRNAFIMTSMMQDVIDRGTATRAKVLERNDIAGKTGTTNDQRDLWFSGFSPKEVAIAWIGYDQPKSLGRHETGGSAALPIWINYMRVALKNTPEKPLTVPDGIVKLKVNPYTGTLQDDDGDGIYEYFYQEYPPPSASTEPGFLDEIMGLVPTPTNPAPAANQSLTSGLTPQEPSAPNKPAAPTPPAPSQAAPKPQDTTNAAGKLLNPSGF